MDTNVKENIINPFTNFSFWKGVADGELESKLEASEVEFIQDLLNTEDLVDENEVVAYAEFQRELLIATLENDSLTYKKFRQSFFLFDENDNNELLELYNCFDQSKNAQQLPYDHRAHSKLYFLKKDQFDFDKDTFSEEFLDFVLDFGFELKEFLAECYQLGIVSRKDLSLVWRILQGETHKLALLPKEVWDNFYPYCILVDMLTVFGNLSAPTPSLISTQKSNRKVRLFNSDSIYKLEIPVYMRLSENITQHLN